MSGLLRGLVLTVVAVWAVIYAWILCDPATQGRSAALVALASVLFFVWCKTKTAT